MSLLLSDDELQDITHLRQPAAQARFLERMRVPYRRRADGTLLVGRAAMERAMLASDDGDQRTSAPAASAGLQWSTPA